MQTAGVTEETKQVSAFVYLHLLIENNHHIERSLVTSSQYIICVSIMSANSTCIFVYQ